MKRIICITCIFVLGIAAFALFPSDAYAAKKSGTYPTQPGRILVTSDSVSRLLPTGHAAIVLDKNNVIEARTKGVVKGKNNWSKAKKEVWGVQVLQKKNGAPLSAAKQKKAVNWCKKHIGKDYNFNYLNTSTRSRFYCSQLIWAAYKDNYKIDLNTSSFAGWYTGYGYANPVHPLELVSTKWTKQVYYYKK